MAEIKIRAKRDEEIDKLKEEIKGIKDRLEKWEKSRNQKQTTLKSGEIWVTKW